MTRVYQKLVGIYREAFPMHLRVAVRQHRRGHTSANSLRKRLTQRVYRPHYVYDQGQLAGFALVINTKLGTHLDYLAVAAHYRGRGFAQQLLTVVLKAYPRVLLECEDHLVKFYQRFGFVDSGLPYSYRGHRLNLMTRGLRPIEVRKLLVELARMDEPRYKLPGFVPYLHYAWIYQCIPFSKHDAWGGAG